MGWQTARQGEQEAAIEGNSGSPRQILARFRRSLARFRRTKHARATNRRRLTSPERNRPLSPRRQ